MSTTLTGSIDVRTNWVYSVDNDVSDSGKDKWSDGTKNKIDFENSGTGQNQVNRLIVQRRTVTSTTNNDDLDLAGGLTDRNGDTVTFSKVKVIRIINRATNNADNLLIGGAGAGNNAWGEPFGDNQDSKDRCYPNDGEWLRSAPGDGMPVTAGSQDVLRVAYDGASEDIPYDLIIYGVQG